MRLQRNSLRMMSLMALAGAGLMLPSVSKADQVYITDFTKNNNIYTNLNEEFPNTGPGTPGSEVGTANSSFLFVPGTYTPPGYITGSNLPNNGINFELTSNSTGQDFEQIDGGTSAVITTSLNDVSNVYLLTGAYNGQSVNVTFTDALGDTQTFNGVSIPDFNGGYTNGTSGGASDQTVFQVNDQGAGGTGNSVTGDYNTYDLTELGFALNSTLASNTLTSISVYSNGYEPLLLGVTAVTPATAGTPLPASAWGGLALVGGLAVLRKFRTGAIA